MQQPFGTSTKAAQIHCPPAEFFLSPPHKFQPSFAEVRKLANKGRIITTDDGVRLFARQPTKPPTANATRPGGRAARLLQDEPIRIYVPMTMRPWVMIACHSNALCHLGSARTLAILEQFYWWIGMSISTRYWVRACHKCQARKTSRRTVRWPIISIPLPSGPGVSISVDYFGPLPRTPRGYSYILLFTDRFSRRADLYAVTDAEFTAEGTANILVNKYIPLCLGMPSTHPLG